MTKGDGLDLLKPFLPGLEAALDDPDVSEIMINGPGNVWLEGHGRLSQIDAPASSKPTRRAPPRSPRPRPPTATRPRRGIPWRPMPPHTRPSVATAQTWPNARAAGGRTREPWPSVRVSSSRPASTSLCRAGVLRKGPEASGI